MQLQQMFLHILTQLLSMLELVIQFHPLHHKQIVIQELEVVNIIQEHIMLELYVKVIPFLLYYLEMISNTFFRICLLFRIYLSFQNLASSGACAAGKIACTEYTGFRQSNDVANQQFSHTIFININIINFRSFRMKMQITYKSV
ncbi:unnamed protein product [Paramecium octaurelia]|uniref:Secreted protein n=1 Tax=Paramecium octaurelia TaxID=43137 RepID=A0A8S1RZ71_PAROT|nr:unnamed protein product [Paramecium octaurelia]